MACLGAVIFRGRSGTNYRFQVWPLGTKFKRLSAVCLFTKRSFQNRNFASTASHESIHIGHTEDLSTLSYDTRYVEDSDCICVHLVDDLTQRLTVERDLVEALGVWNTALHVELGMGQASIAERPAAAVDL